MNSKKYLDSKAFRAALEQRLQNYANSENKDLQEIRRRVAFERFLCRMVAAQSCPWVLKGGYAMELRIDQSRATRDIDLVLKRDFVDEGIWEDGGIQVLEIVREYASIDLGDHFKFLIDGPKHDLENAPYGGARYPVSSLVDGRTFVKFHIDISSSDRIDEAYEELEGDDWLAFASIPTGSFPAISKEQQFSEKLHAYTMPRGDRPNSRYRDLVDMVLLIEGEELVAAEVRSCLSKTFSIRNTHKLPEMLEYPPEFWKEPFAEIATRCQLDPDMKTQFGRVKSFVEQIASS